MAEQTTGTSFEWLLGKISAAVKVFTGDSGTGGAVGLVPAPAAGDAAARKFLSAGGGWGVPSGSGSGVSYADRVTPSGAIDGVNHDFTLPFAPDPPESLILVLHGIVQLDGEDFTLTGAAIEYTVAPAAGLWMRAWLRH